MKRILLMITALVLALNLWGCDAQSLLDDLFETEPTAPAQTLNSILDVLEDAGGEISLSVHTDRGQIYGPHTLDRLPELDPAVGREIPDPSGLGRYESWLVLSAGDADAVLTVYVGNKDLLCVEEDGVRSFYRDESGNLVRPLRRCFDRMEYEALTVPVEPVVATPSGILREYASSAYPAARSQLSPGSIYGFRDYDLISYQLEKSDGAAVIGTFIYAALPDAADSILYEQGQLLTESPHEGYVLMGERVRLEPGDDGFWYPTESEVLPS